MESILIIALAVAAIYSGGAYLYVTIRTLRNAETMSSGEIVFAETNTFHLGLCFILAVGFLYIGSKV